MSDGLNKTVLELADQFSTLIQLAAEIPLDTEIEAEEWQETAVIRSPDGRFLRWENNSKGGEFKQQDPATLTSKDIKTSVDLNEASRRTEADVINAAKSLEHYQTLRALAGNASPKASKQVAKIVDNAIGKTYTKLNNVSKFNFELDRQQDIAQTPIFLKNPKQAWFGVQDLTEESYRNLSNTFETVTQPAVLTSVGLTVAGTALAVGVTVLQKKLKLLDGGMEELVKKAGAKTVEGAANLLGDLAKDAPFVGKAIKQKKAYQELDKIYDVIEELKKAKALDKGHLEKLDLVNRHVQQAYGMQTFISQSTLTSMREAIAAVGEELEFEESLSKTKLPDPPAPKKPKTPKSEKPTPAQLPPPKMPETKVPPLKEPTVSPPPGTHLKPKKDDIRVTKNADNNWSQASIEHFLSQVQSSSKPKDQISDNLSDFAVAMFGQPEYMKRCDAIIADANTNGMFDELTPEDFQDMKSILQDPDMQVMLKKVFSEYGGMAAIQSSTPVKIFDISPELPTPEPQPKPIQAAFAWEPSDHPRDKDGKFGKKSGSGSIPTRSKKDAQAQITTLETKYGSNARLNHSAGTLDALNDTAKESVRKSMFGASAVNRSKDVLAGIKSKSAVGAKIFKEKLGMVDALKDKTFKGIADAQKSVVSHTSKFVNEDHPGLVASVAFGAAVLAATCGTASILSLASPLTFLVPEEMVLSFDAAASTIELTEEGIAYIRTLEALHRGVNLVKGLSELCAASSLFSISDDLSMKQFKKDVKNIRFHISAEEGISVAETREALEAGAMALMDKLQDYAPLTNPTLGDLAALLNIPPEGLRARPELTDLVNEFRAKLVRLISAFLKIKSSGDYIKTLKKTSDLQQQCHKLSVEITGIYRHGISRGGN